MSQGIFAYLHSFEKQKQERLPQNAFLRTTGLLLSIYKNWKTSVQCQCLKEGINTMIKYNYP